MENTNNARSIYENKSSSEEWITEESSWKYWKAKYGNKIFISKKFNILATSKAEKKNVYFKIEEKTVDKTTLRFKFFEK